METIEPIYVSVQAEHRLEDGTARDVYFEGWLCEFDAKLGAILIQPSYTYEPDGLKLYVRMSDVHSITPGDLPDDYRHDAKRAE